MFASIEPTHPSKILREHIEAKGLTANQVARLSGFSLNHVRNVMRGTTRISNETSKFLGPRIGLAPNVLVDAQIAHNRWVAYRRQGGV